MPANSILIVEDDGILCSDMEDMLLAEGYEVMDLLPSGEAALKLVKQRQPDLIIMDIKLAGELNGISTVEQIKKIADIPVIYITAYTEDTLIRRARETVPHAYLVKPVQERELIATIEMVLHRHRLEQKLRQTEGALRQSEQRLVLAQQIAKTGDFTWNVKTGEVAWSDGLYGLLRYDKSEKFDYARLKEEIFHPDDLERVTKWLNDCIESGMAELVPHEYRLIRKDKEEICVYTAGIIERGKDKQIRVFATLQDITARKQVEEALQTALNKYQTIMQTSMDGFWLVNTSGRFLDVNAAYCKMIGYTREELLNMGIADVEALESPADVAGHMEKILKKGSDRFETKHRCKTGQTIDLEVSVNYLPVGDGELFVFMRDITARKQVEEALQESEKSLKEAQQLARLGRWELDISNNLLNWSDTVYEIFEIEPGNFGANYDAFWTAIHPEDRAKVDQIYRDSLVKHQPYQINHRLLMPDGRVKWVHEQWRTEYDDQGKALRSVGTVQDITELKQAEEELRFKEQAITSSNNAIALAELEGTIIYVNPAFLKLWGYKKEAEVLGRSVRDFWGKREKVTEVFGFLFNSDEYSGELVAKRTDGEPRFLHASAAIVHAKDGTPVGITASFNDITERKAAEEKLNSVLNEFETVFQGTLAAMFLVKVIDGNTFRFMRNNQAHAKATGISTKIMTAKTPQELVGAELGATIAANYKRCVEAKDSISYEEILALPGGERTWYTTLTPIFKQGRISYLVGSSLDISARKRAEAEARRVEALQAMENERMRLARDLHDEMGALLYALKLDLQLLSTQLAAADVQKGEAKLHNSISKINSAITTVRQKSASLRSPALDVLGLSDVLADMVEEMGRKTGIKITLKLAGELPEFSPEIDNTLYRCIQEALTNGARHAGAASITVELGWNEEEVNVTITDDGVGFDPGVINDYSSGHLGLRGMQERVFLVKGSFDIKSVPGQGAMISITLPLAKK